MKRTRILLADDHPLTLIGIRIALEPHHEIVGTMTDGQPFWMPRSLAPGADCHGYQHAIAKRHRRSGPNHEASARMKLLFVTMHDSPAYLVAALQAGATGYVLKSAALDELLEAINAP